MSRDTCDTQKGVVGTPQVTPTSSLASTVLYMAYGHGVAAAVAPALKTSKTDGTLQNWCVLAYSLESTSRAASKVELHLVSRTSSILGGNILQIYYEQPRRFSTRRRRSTGNVA